MEQEGSQRIERVLSKERLSGDQTKRAQPYFHTPLAVYRWNTILYESLYPAIQTIEIILRNAIFLAIAEHFGEPYWLLPAEFLDPKELMEVKNQELRLQRSGKAVTMGNLIAKLNFGFWTALLDARYEMTLWRSKIIKRTFPHRFPQHRIRHRLSRHFNKIRKLRNRIFHHEPVGYWQDLKEQHENIQIAISWREPAALALCAPDRFLVIYSKSSEAAE